MSANDSDGDRPSQESASGASPNSVGSGIGHTSQLQNLPLETLGNIFDRFSPSEAIAFLSDPLHRGRAVDLIKYVLLTKTALDCAYIGKWLAIKRHISAPDAPERLKILWSDLQGASWPYLHVTNLEVNPDLPQKELLSIIEKCPNLLLVDLSKYSKFSDRNLQEIVERCPHLHTLDLTDAQISDEGLAAVAKYCQRLQNLHLSFCYQITDSGVAEIARSCVDLRLISLAFCCQITDAGITEIARHCRGLQTFFPSFCYRMTDIGVAEIAHYCADLKTLTLSGCYVGDFGITEIANHCRKLQTFNILSAKTTDVGISEIAKKCGGLLSLTVARCSLITDAGVVELIKNCPKLQTLFLWDCGQITEAGILRAAKHHKGLQTLKIRGTYISPQGIADLQQTIKNVKVEF